MPDRYDGDITGTTLDAPDADMVCMSALLREEDKLQQKIEEKSLKWKKSKRLKPMSDPRERTHDARETNP